MFKQAKDYEQAVVSFRQASSGGADSLEAIFSLGFCLEKLGREEEAKNEYFKIVSDPVSQNDYKIKAYFRIAKIYEKENDLESAEEIYKKVVASGVEEAKIAKVRLEELERR
jgi:tetratricopeptide (TPR) repeat protein